MITTPHSRPFSKLMLNRLSDAGLDLTKLVLYSTFDDDNRVTDITGNENHGALTGAYINGIGRYGKGLFVDNVDDLVTIANENNFDVGATEDITVWAWINMNTIDASTIFVKGSGSEFYEFFVAANGEVKMEINDGVIDKIAGAGGTVLTTGRWYCVAGVIDRTQNLLSIYVDGILSGATADITGLVAISNANSPTISVAASPLGGNMDIIGFTKEVLNINTLQNLCNKGL